VTPERTHQRLFRLADVQRPLLEDLLDKLDEIDIAGNGLPEEARGLQRGIREFLAQYLHPRREDRPGDTEA
jgi:hypothetical protein